MEISIFQTSVVNEDQINKLAPLLNNLAGLKNWNFDLEDPDNILRVKYPPAQNNFLASEIRKYGFACVELY
jgi:hypothetical protein